MAGLQAAVDVASAGVPVYLVDRAASIGGLMPQLDKTFPTNDCGMCFIAPKEEDRSGCLRSGVAVWRHPRITVWTNAEVQTLEGTPGHFRATVALWPRFIDLDRCTACGLCAQVCPERAIHTYNAGLEQHPAAYLPFPQALPRAYAIDKAACTECGLCVAACPVEAVRLADTPKTQEINIAAVILAPGNQVYDPTPLKQYLYGQHPNVITSLEFERLYSGTGPTLGRLVRPSDGQPPKKIAWLQCIGSRDIKTHAYCSQVCCMYALKEAMIAKERLGPEVETTIFYMDMRVVGKDYEQYYTKAREHYGVRCICYRVPALAPAGNGDIRIEYYDAKGGKQAEDFQLVVLASGFEVGAAAQDLATRLGIDLDRHHYPVTDPALPVATNRPGVYVCGTFQAPKDIPDSLMEASAAAACGLLAAGGPQPENLAPVDIVPEVPASPPRLGIFFCGWGPDIDQVMDGPALHAYAAGLPGVAVSAAHPLDCGPQGLAALAQQAAAALVNRVIIAACTPMINEPRLKEAFQRVGINKYLIEVVHLRAEVSGVHVGDREGATAKAQALLRRAAARVASLEPLVETRLTITPQALVVGGGVAGMTAARNLADQGVTVHLLEKTRQLGGLARRLSQTIEGWQVQPYLQDLIQQVTTHPNIQVHLASDIVSHQGRKGAFLTTIASGPERRTEAIKHGVMIIATGAGEYRPREFLSGSDPRIMTQLDLAARLREEPQLAAAWQRVIMIQCVGSRSADNPTCSRICCQTAVKHALALKERAPGLDVVIFHRDVRMYGLLEDYYTAARDQKVLFERFDPTRPPRVEKDGDQLQVLFYDMILQRWITWPVDAVILSAAIVPTDTRELAQMLRLPQDPRGFWVEAHPKMRPVDLAAEGYYVCGTAHSPRLLKEAVVQGLAVAARAGAFLAAASQAINPLVAEVAQGLCVGCLACVRSCPYGIPQMDERHRSQIDPALCLGCGICAGVCPAGAIRFKHYTDAQLNAELEAWGATA
uniref:4Fe-4S binding protein n=1 Tax=Desulfobacca sp. TaxID=2067990 RepID=UPI004049FDF3